MHGSAIMAWLVYNTATRAEMMPRLKPTKPLKIIPAGANATD
jgi:hypothetical protein